jgi:hypothetical protein
VSYSFSITLFLEMRYIGLIVLFFMLTSSCGNKKSASETQLTDNKVTTEQKSGPTLIIDQSGGFDQGDHYDIFAARIEGDSLHMTISHGGGCKVHEFKLYTNGAMMKSLPPKINLILHHNGNEDNCRALIQKEIAFNIGELKSMSNGRIIINLSNFDQPLEYNY